VLRITINETPTEKRWILQGRLVGPWVGELRTIWKKTQGDGHGGQTCIVDLNDVTFVDKGGERLLRAMSKQGARFVANGIYIKYVLEQLNTNNRRGPFMSILGLGFLAFIACSPSMHVKPELGTRDAKQEFKAQFNSNNGWNSSTCNFADGLGGILCPHS
jgi:hypothetical protein